MSTTKLPPALARQIMADYDYPDPALDPVEVQEEIILLSEPCLAKHYESEVGDYFIHDGVCGAVYRETAPDTWGCVWSSC